MITVRRGHKDDFKEIESWLHRVWGDDDYVHYLWPEWAQKQTEGILLVALYQNSIVGTCYVNFMPGNTCWFQALRVHPDYRRRGVGRALTKASMDEARNSGNEYAYLGIDGDNTASLTLTAQAGFNKVSEYARLIKALPAAADTEASCPNHWRKAVVGDVDAMLRLGEHFEKKQLIACWQWQPFSREAILQNITGNNLWVWDQEELFMWAGFEDFFEHPHLFDPCGSSEDVKKLITTLIPCLTRSQDTNFEVWLHCSNPLTTHLTEQMGFAREEGYTIWEYKL